MLLNRRLSALVSRSGFGAAISDAVVRSSSVFCTFHSKMRSASDLHDTAWWYRAFFAICAGISIVQWDKTYYSAHHGAGLFCALLLFTLNFQLLSLSLSLSLSLCLWLQDMCHVMPFAKQHRALACIVTGTHRSFNHPGMVEDLESLPSFRRPLLGGLFSSFAYSVSSYISSLLNQSCSSQLIPQ